MIIHKYLKYTYFFIVQPHFQKNALNLKIVTLNLSVSKSTFKLVDSKVGKKEILCVNIYM